MSLGSVYVKYTQKYKHGIKAAWYRDVVRPQILKTQPFADTKSTRCEIHVLTSQDDSLNLLWALKSFYHYAKCDYSLCIHSDGSLNNNQIASFNFHFPNARVISKLDADEIMAQVLSNYPNALRFRQSNHLAPKLFDFKHFLQSDRMLLLDSDVLFFSYPEELMKRIENTQYTKNTFNKDVMYGYTIPFEELQPHLDFDLIPFFNSGLGLIHKESINFDWIEKFLALPNIVGHFWRIEQTLFALCSSKFGVELLPEEYNVRLDKGIKGLVSRHYVGRIRHLMYTEGIRQLQRQKFLESIS
jgi:hypothetical protein